jgi:hypothetical protein
MTATDNPSGAWLCAGMLCEQQQQQQRLLMWLLMEVLLG